MEENELDGLDEFFENQRKADQERFGVKSHIQQILWDAQVPDEHFNEAFAGIITTIRQCSDNSDLMRQINEIDLNDYPIDE